MYVKDTVENQTALPYTSTGVSLLLFIAILIYHTFVFVLKTSPIWRKMKNIPKWKQPVNYLHEDVDDDDDEEQSGDSFHQTRAS